MTKLSTKKLSIDRSGFLIDQLWRGVTLLEDKNEVHKFLHDLLTRTELLMLAKRLQVIKMLNEGSSYQQIRSDINISDVTIAKLHNWYEEFGDGFRLVVGRLQELERKRKEVNTKPLVTGQVRAAQQVWVGGAKEIIKVYKKHRKRKSVVK